VPSIPRAVISTDWSFGMLKAIMTKSTVIAVSVVRDFLDLFIHIPGIDQLLDIPVLYVHFRYAGPRALVALPELIPFVGVVPLYTLLAISYPSHSRE